MSDSISLVLGTLLYTLAKIVGYSWWCAVGLKRLRRDLNSAQIKRSAIKLGLVRFAIGVVVGVPMTVVFGTLANMTWLFLSYLLTYVPVRWFEWGIMIWLMDPATRSARQLLRGNSRIERVWRQQGIALSCALDLVLFLCAAFGLKGLGRIFC